MTEETRETHPGDRIKRRPIRMDFSLRQVFQYYFLYMPLNKFMCTCYLNKGSLNESLIHRRFSFFIERFYF